MPKPDTRTQAELEGAPEQPPPAATTAVRLLLDCSHGKVNDVVELPASEAAVLVTAFQADDTPEAVAYARTLPQNQLPAEPQA